MTRGPVRGLDRLPGAPAATARVDESYARVFVRVLRSPLVVPPIALGAFLWAVGDSVVLWLVTVGIAFGAIFAMEALFLVDGANAAADGWLASRWAFRWRYVRIDRLSNVTAIRGGFWFKDRDGGRAALPLTRPGAMDVLRVVRTDLIRARENGTRLPDGLSDLLNRLPAEPAEQ